MAAPANAMLKKLTFTLVAAAGVAACSARVDATPYPDELPDGDVILPDGAVVPNPDAARETDSGGGAGGDGSGAEASADGSDGGPGVDAGTDADAGKDAAPDAKPIVDAGPPPPRLTNATLLVGGRTRSWLQVTPGFIDPKKSYPIIFLFHGDGGGTGAGLHSYIPYEQISGNDAVLVFPDGLGPSGTGGAWDIENPVAKNYDYGIVPAITAAIGAKVKIDGKRVFGWGFSNGGYFVEKASCVVPGIFRAVASNSGGQPYNGGGGESYAQFPNGCLQCPGRVPALIVHGTADTVVSYGTGQYEATCQADVNGCSQTTTATSPAPCAAYQGCAGGNSVTFCGIQNMGHQVWNSMPSASWAFFQTFP